MKGLKYLLIAGVVMLLLSAYKADAQLSVGDTMTVKVWRLSTPPKRLAELAKVDAITDHFIILVPARSYPVVAIDARRDGAGDNHIEAVAGLREYYLMYKKSSATPWKWYLASPTYWNKMSPTVNAVFVDPGYIRRVYIGHAGGISVSNSMGASWVKNDNLKSMVNDIVNNPLTSNRGIELYVATNNGFYRGVVDNPARFADLTWDTLGLTGENVVSITVDPVDTSVVYLATSNTIYKYTDGDGLTQLAELDTSVSINKIRAIYSSDSSNSIVLVGTSDGLYYSPDGNSFLLENGTAGIDVKDIGAIDENELLIATAGLGVLKKDHGDWGSVVWDTLSEGLSSEIMSNYVNAIAVPSSGEYYIGTEAGVYRWNATENRWDVFVPGVSLTEDDISAFRQEVNSLEENDFISTYLHLLNVDPQNLYDVDGVPQIFLYYNYKLFVGGIATQAYGHILGYYDPLDETDPEGNQKEIFIINHADYAAPEDSILRQFYLPYLFGRYVAWSMDHDERGSVNAGITLAVLDSMGYAIPTTSYALSSSSNTNPFTWPSDAFEAEADRERAYLFYEYLWEHFGFGVLSQIISEQLNSNIGVDTVLKLYHDFNLDDVIVGWQVANLIDNPDIDPFFGYSRIDFSFDPGDVNGVVTSPTAGSRVEAPLYGASYWQFSASDTAFVFNGTDESVLKVISIVGDSVDTVDIDTVTNTYRWSGNNSDGFIVAVNYKLVAPGFTLLSADIESPSVDLFTIPNIALNRYVNFYAYGSELLYSDVDKSGPTVIAVKGDGTDTLEVSLGSFAQLPDSSIYLYFSATELPDWEGDVIVSLWAQDISGNPGNPVSDTIGILKLNETGGEYSLLNGEIKFEVPSGVDYRSTIVVSSVTSREFGVTFKDNGISDDALSPVYIVSSGQLPSPITMKVRVNGDQEGNLYKYENGNWIKVKSYRSGIYILAMIDDGGIYQVRKDGTGNGSLQFGIASPSLANIGTPVRFSISVPDGGDLEVKILDASGRVVTSVYKGWMNSGVHEFTWNPNKITSLHSGVYFFTAKWNGTMDSHKIVLIK